MKQKQVKTTPKVAKQTKTIKKASPPKKVHVMPEESDGSEEEQKVQTKVVKKPVTKKATKAKKVVVEEPMEEVEDEPEEEDVEDPEEDAADEEEQKEDMEENDDEDEDEEEEEDDDDDEDEDDDDEGPSEEAIGTEEPTIPSKVKSGPIPPTLPVQTIIHVSNLPKQCQHTDLVEAFHKYGEILRIHLVSASFTTFADIAFKTEKAALAAIADQKVEVLDSLVSVSKKRKGKKDSDQERCVRVNNITPNTTAQQLREHFESCGEIQRFKLIDKNGAPLVAYIVFEEKPGLKAALKLHNSIVNDSNIKVTATSDKNKVIRQYNERLSVMMKNNKEFKVVDVAKIEKIFSKCGQINFIDVICKKNILAFITFTRPEAAERALKMSGETQEDIELEIEPYSPFKKWTTVHISNIPRDCTEEELRHHFSRAGEIVRVIIGGKYAIIRFADSEGFCKSFLYNESSLRGHTLFIQPSSKRNIPNFGNNRKKSLKRPIENEESSPKAKKPRND